MPKKNLLIACTGSVATVKVPEMVLSLSKFFNITLIGTSAAKHFLNLSYGYNREVFQKFLNILTRQGLSKITELMKTNGIENQFKVSGNGSVNVFFDEDEWVPYKNVKKDPVLHIELRKWADILLVAPLSANTLAKLSNGLSDNLLSCVVRAWNSTKQIVVCPAMNVVMWENPFTKKHLKSLGNVFPKMEIVEPIEKELACGDTGKGALAPVDKIVEKLVSMC